MNDPLLNPGPVTPDELRAEADRYEDDRDWAIELRRAADALERAERERGELMGLLKDARDFARKVLNDGEILYQQIDSALVRNPAPNAEGSLPAGTAHGHPQAEGAGPVSSEA